MGEAWPLIRRKVSKPRLLNDIYETARSSTALPVEESPAAVTMFRMVLAEARSLIRQRDQKPVKRRAEICWPRSCGRI